MALLWIEGFEGFGTSSTPSPTGIVSRKYSVAAENAMTVQTGRTGGYALRMVNANCSFKTSALTTDDTMIVGAGVRSSNIASAANQPIIMMVDGVTAGMQVHINGDGTLTVKRGTTVLGTSTNNMSSNTWYYIEFKVVCHNSTGSYELRVNDTNWLSATGIDTQIGSNAYHDVVKFTGSNFTSSIDFDDIYVCDSTGTRNNNFLGNVKVLAIRPDSAGDDTDWTPDAGANYAAVDEVVLDEDTTFVETSGSGDQDLYNYGSLAASGVIKGLQIVTETRVTDATSFDLNAVIKSGTTEDAGSSETITSTSYVTHTRVAETDPDTSDTWQASAVNSCQFGIKAT
jgi:hypothetical protein